MATDGIDFLNREGLTKNPSDNGVVTLQWEASGKEVEVQRSVTPDFQKPRLVYRGTQTASVVTGLREGEYYFRIRDAEEAEWSPALAVRVEYISRTKLFVLLSLGGVVVMGTIGAIFSGYRSNRTGGGEE